MPEPKTASASCGDGETYTTGPEVEVEVAYATPDCQLIIKARVPPGTTAAKAIEVSGIRRQFPQIEAQPAVGIFSRKVALDHPLAAGDRVEIYRPLIADPKEVRRQKAIMEKEGRKGKK